MAQWLQFLPTRARVRDGYRSTGRLTCGLFLPTRARVRDGYRPQGV